MIFILMNRMQDQSVISVHQNLEDAKQAAVEYWKIGEGILSIEEWVFDAQEPAHIYGNSKGEKCHDEWELLM
jgi:hypothetical protein